MDIQEPVQENREPRESRFTAREMMDDALSTRVTAMNGRYWLVISGLSFRNVMAGLAAGDSAVVNDELD